MKELSIENIPDKAFCSVNLYLDDDYILTCPDTPILPSLKKRLESWHYSSIFVDRDPEFTEIISSVSAEGMLLNQGTGESEQELEADDFYNKLCDFVDKIYLAFRVRNDLKINLISDQVKNLIQMIKTHKVYLLNFAEYESEDIDYNVSQAVKTTILVLAMSETLRLPVHKQIELGLAALLHRIGVMQIPQELFYTDRDLTPEEKKSITLFPLLGFKALRAAEFPTTVALAVLEHRENIDGSGYPRGFTGDKISLYGKLLSVASAYCATVSKRPFRENLDGHSGMMELIKEKGRKYDEKVLRVLLLTLTVYPIGTYIKMTDGSIGIVSETNTAEPKFPVLKMIHDANHTFYADAPMLHTSENDEVQIDRALNREEVEELRSKLPGNF